MNEDQITTAAGIIKAGVIVLGLFGVSISPESQVIILKASAAIYAAATLIGGWFTNKKVS